MSGRTAGPWRKALVKDTTTAINPEPDRWEIIGPDESVVVATAIDRDYYYPEAGILNEADADLIAAAPDLLHGAKDTLLFFRRSLENLVYVSDSDASGHPHGYSIARMPDWEVRQKIEWLERTIAEAEGRT